MRETHSTQYRDDSTGINTPYFFREKSALWDWDDDVVFEPRYPNTLLVRPRSSVAHGTKSLTADQREKLQALRAVHTAGPVIVEGFAEPAKTVQAVKTVKEVARAESADAAGPAAALLGMMAGLFRAYVRMLLSMW